jgi:hypothetical protein
MLDYSSPCYARYWLVTSTALTIDAHMEKLRELRDKADQRGQTNAAIRAEELRGQLRLLCAAG